MYKHTNGKEDPIQVLFDNNDKPLSQTMVSIRFNKVTSHALHQFKLSTRKQHYDYPMGYFDTNKQASGNHKIVGAMIN